MALPMVALAAGVSFVGWKTSTPSTKLVAATLLVATVYDDVLFEDNDFGPGDLLLSAAIAFGVMGVSN